MEESLRNSLRQLENYKYALDESSIVTITDQNGIIRQVNDNFCKISKYSREELIGRDHGIMNSGFHPEEFFRDMWENISNGKIWRGEVKNKAKDGTYFWLDSTIVPFPDELSKPFQYAAIRSDITKQKMQEENIILFNEQLQKRVEEKTKEISEKEFFLRESQRAGNIGSYKTNFITGYWQSSETLDGIFGIDKNYDRNIAGWLELVHPDDRQMMDEYLRQEVVGKQKPFNKEYRIIRNNDNETRWVQEYGYIKFDDRGNSLELIGTIQDITERKTVDEKLTESMFALMEAQRISHIGSWFLNISETNEIPGQIVWSKEMYKIHGVSMDSFTPTVESLINLIHPDDRLLMQNWIYACITGKKSGELEFRIILPDGAIRIISGRGELICDAQNKPHSIRGTAQDITERKKSEEEMLRHSSILEATSDFVGIATPDQRIVFLNKAGRIALGIGEKEDLSQGIISDFFPAWANEIILKEGVPAAINTGKWIGETTFRTRAGVEIPVSQVAIAHKNANGQLQYLSTIARDITLQKEAKQKLKKFAAELQASNIELERFAYVASHDLQEPLRMVTSFLGLLKKKYNEQLDDTGRSYLRFAVDGAGRMRSLIQDLLLFSKVDNHDEMMQLVDCNELMDEVQHDLLSSITESEAILRVNPLPGISGYKSQLKQVLQNLVSNAIKYRSEKPPLIEISCEEKENHWQFCIKDNGMGIDPKFFDKIFVIFQRLHNKDKFSGTGIGLAVAKKIAERHGGIIWVESESGKGSSFYFTIGKKA